MTWLVAALSLTATWLNIRVRACFAIWAAANAAWAFYDFAPGCPLRAR